MRTLFLLLCFFPLLSPGQGVLQGRVLDENQKPLPEASIFLSNTSIGTRSDANGYFQLRVPQGRFDLVVSSVGYQTFTKNIHAASLDQFLTVQLSIKEKQLETIVIEPYEKNGWKTWGLLFTGSFIGSSAAAALCKIENIGVIRFRFNKKQNLLTAHALAPLVITNRHLGYTIQYQLEHFSYDLNKGHLTILGFPFFQEIKAGNARKKKWEKHRMEAYEGSMMHFMRAVYRNRLFEEGFEVRRLQKIENTEKKRISALYASQVRRTPGGVFVAPGFEKDSTDYYRDVMNQKDELDLIGKEVLPGDSIAYAVDSLTAGMDFENFLLIIYKNNWTPAGYAERFPENGRIMISQITLIDRQPVEIAANGSYFDPASVLCIGYWAWSEKLVKLLPFDYRPGK